MFKSLNEVLIEWNKSSKKDSENPGDTFISVKGNDLKFHFKFVFTNDEESPLRKKGCFRSVDSWDGLFIWMSYKDTEKLWNIIYNRLKQLLGNKDKYKEAFILLKDNFIKIFPGGDFSTASENWYYFIWYLIIEDILIEIYEDDIKSENLLYRGTLEELQYQEDSATINNNLAQMGEEIPAYRIGRFIQSITEPDYSHEAFPCILINEFIRDWTAPPNDVPLLDYSDPKVIDIIKSIRKSLNIK